jgi:hypothetical protein
VRISDVLRDVNELFARFEGVGPTLAGLECTPASIEDACFTAPATFILLCV